MSRPLRPSSERYSVCCSVPDSGSFCSQEGRHISSSDGDDTPIFSISKSSMDVLAASSHLRDPAFCRADKARCSSTSEQNCRLTPVQSSARNASPLTKHNLEMHNPPPQQISDRWFNNMQRWSSCSAQSRSSTPDTVIFKGPSSSMALEKLPDSTKVTSPPPGTPSPPVSPELTPTIPLANLQGDVSVNSLQFSLLQAKHMSPLPARELLCFTFPSPVSSTVSLEKFAAEDPLYAVKNSITDAGVEELFTDILPGDLELPVFGNPDFLLRDFTSFQWTRRPKLAGSYSDPHLWKCCRCCEHLCKDVGTFRELGGHRNHEKGTMTSEAELVDVGVQTSSPVGSWWNLRRNNSIVGSPSILGSPPGSLLNLRSPVGSHFNLLSPSSSMFQIDSDDDDDDDSKAEKENFSIETSSNTDVERRSCLKVRSENREMGRRSSMKQVQWDEDGMTWDVHGASIDPEELNMAIQKHLELKSNEEDEEKPLKRKSSKKNRAPKPPVQPVPPAVRIEAKESDEGRDEATLAAEVKELDVRRRCQSPGPVQRRKRRSFKRPTWCGGSKKHQD